MLKSTTTTTSTITPHYRLETYSLKTLSQTLTSLPYSQIPSKLKLPGILVHYLQSEEQLQTIIHHLLFNGNKTIGPIKPILPKILRPLYTCNLIQHLHLKNLDDELAIELTVIHFPSLHVLHISDSPKLTHQGLQSCYEVMYSLHELYLERCPRISIGNVISLLPSQSINSKPSHLEILHLYSNANITLSDIPLLLTSSTSLLCNIKQLFIESPTSSLLPAATTTTTTTTTKQQQQQQTHHLLPQLTCLSLTNIFSLPFHYLSSTIIPTLQLANTNNHLVHLSLSSCSNITSRYTLHTIATSPILSNHLMSLDLSQTDLILSGDPHEDEAWQSFTKLTTLNLAGIHSIEPLGLDSLAHYCPTSLLDLNISSSLTLLRRGGMSATAVTIQETQYASSISALFCKPQIKSLILDENMISDGLFDVQEQLLDATSSLKYFSLRSCIEIRNLSFILHQMRELEEIYLDETCANFDFIFSLLMMGSTPSTSRLRKISLRKLIHSITTQLNHEDQNNYVNILKNIDTRNNPGMFQVLEVDVQGTRIQDHIWENFQQYCCIWVKFIGTPTIQIFDEQQQQQQQQPVLVINNEQQGANLVNNDVEEETGIFSPSFRSGSSSESSTTRNRRFKAWIKLQKNSHNSNNELDSLPSPSSSHSSSGDDDDDGDNNNSSGDDVKSFFPFACHCNICLQVFKELDPLPIVKIRYTKQQLLHMKEYI
jgi:hypothetical protein